MLLKYFYDQKLAHASYLVGCQATGEAIIIDPGRDIASYLEEASRNKMQIVAAAETHIHADFVSGARELAEHAGAVLYLSDEGDENWKYEYLDGYEHDLLKDGDTFKIGKVRFSVMHTPGHTPEHISIILTDQGGGASQPMGIFTGDFIFVGSMGRPDLLEKAAKIADTSVAGARQQFQSAQRFKQLPDYLQVWPAHGAGSVCGKGLGSVPSSTVGYEKRFNPMLIFDEQQEEAFVKELLEGQPEPPTYFAIMKRVNKEGPPLLSGPPSPEKLEAVLINQALDDGYMVIDTRPTHMFARKHVSGSINIPAHELPQWAGWIVNYDQPLYLVSNPDHIRQEARDLAYIGIDNVAGYFDYAEIVNQDGINFDAYVSASAQALKSKILNDEVTLLDVRREDEWEEGRLPNAQHLMLGFLLDKGQSLIDGKDIVVQCRTGNRSAIAASILKAMGARQVINMEGGIEEWQASGLPVET